MIPYSARYMREGFEGMCTHMTRDFLLTAENEGITEVGDWQSINVGKLGLPQGKTVEMRNVVMEYDIPEFSLVDVAHIADDLAVDGCENLDTDIHPNQPFAELQFQDRVSGEPLNPPPSFDYWPWNKAGQEHQGQDAKFSHTYPERFWPKHANGGPGEGIPIDEMSDYEIDRLNEGHYGIRFRYGDLNDLVAQLARSPSTRQAYLPVWFPEDTGAVHGERVPCTLGYWFVRREGKLHCTYLIRSVDFLRHFRDDVYMACRLVQWILDELRSYELSEQDPTWHDAKPGTLTMWMGSFHVFEGDLPRLRRDIASK